MDGSRDPGQVDLLRAKYILTHGAGRVKPFPQAVDKAGKRKIPICLYGNFAYFVAIHARCGHVCFNTLAQFTAPNECHLVLQAFSPHWRIWFQPLS